ncbi:MAG: ribbon-helix-helix protein, CopG family [Pseudanabaena sp.]
MNKSKTISAHVTSETIAKIDHLAKLENRSRSQLTGAVVELGGDLPHDAWTALLQIKAMGTAEDWQALQRDLTRTLLNHRYRLLQQKMSTQGDQQWLDTLETEDDILNAAVNNYENFKKIGLIGSVATDQQLSINYKQILAEGWAKKYDHS